MLGRAGRRHLPAGRWLAVVAGLSILGWTVPALLMLRKGFAIEDEGSYVLSYRHWQGRPYFVSGSQYLYGPVFHALGESIPALRALRLIMVLGVNLWFSRSFLTWLERGRPGQLPAPRGALTLLLVAVGGMTYLWTPLTPGYYDLTADCCLALVALLLVTLAQPAATPWWIPISAGIVGVGLVLTKWTALPVAVLTFGVAIYVILRTSKAALIRYLALLAVGVVLALTVCQLALVPLGQFIPTMRRVSSLTTVGSHSMRYLAGTNVRDTVIALIGATIVGVPLLAGLFIARALNDRGRPSAASKWLVVGAAVTSLVLPFVFGWHGGDDRGRVVISSALAGLLAAFVAAALSGPRAWMPSGSADRLVAAVLLLVPFAQAAGTNVPVLYVAFECLAMWVALVLLLVSAGGCCSFPINAVLIDLSVAAVATSMICGTTTLETPFKTSGYGVATVRVPALGLDVSANTAREYSALRRAVAPQIQPGRTPVFAMDQNAGLIYLLDGVPAGSTWNDAASPTRTAGILALACRNGDVSQAPVLLLSRPVDRDLAEALHVCGFDYPRAYRSLPIPGGPPHLSVLVPLPDS